MIDPRLVRKKSLSVATGWICKKQLKCNNVVLFFISLVIVYSSFFYLIWNEPISLSDMVILMIIGIGFLWHGWEELKSHKSIYMDACQIVFVSAYPKFKLSRYKYSEIEWMDIHLDPRFGLDKFQYKLKGEGKKRSQSILLKVGEYRKLSSNMKIAALLFDIQCNLKIFSESEQQSKWDLVWREYE